MEREHAIDQLDIWLILQDVGDKTTLEKATDLLHFIENQIGMMPPCCESFERNLDHIYEESLAGRACLEAIMSKESLSREEFLHIWDSKRKTFYNPIKSSYRWDIKNKGEIR